MFDVFDVFGVFGVFGIGFSCVKEIFRIELRLSLLKIESCTFFGRSLALPSGCDSTVAVTLKCTI